MLEVLKKIKEETLQKLKDIALKEGSIELIEDDGGNVGCVISKNEMIIFQKDTLHYIYHKESVQEQVVSITYNSFSEKDKGFVIACNNYFLHQIRVQQERIKMQKQEIN